VGKGTIARRLIENDDHLWLSRSWTTRPIRPTENGSEYVFVDRDTFVDAVDHGNFLEWAEFHGHLYGTPQPTPPAGMDVLLEIEVQGAEQVRAKDPDAVVILLVPPSLEELEGRLVGRGDPSEHVGKRLDSTPDELRLGRALATVEIVNDDIDRAANEILSILGTLRQTRRNPS
jgi:guanylate kinase